MKVFKSRLISILFLLLLLFWMVDYINLYCWCWCVFCRDIIFFLYITVFLSVIRCYFSKYKYLNFVFVVVFYREFLFETKTRMHPVLTLLLQILYTLVLMAKAIIVGIYKLVVPYRYRAKSVTGEIALVTGAGSGIGKLMAKKLSTLGVKLVLVDVDEKANEKTANEILLQGGQAKTFTCDLSKRDEIYRVADEVCLNNFHQYFYITFNIF